MTEFGFFASQEGDRIYSDVDFANYYKDLVTSGVLLSSAEALQVRAGVNMTLSIGDGGAMIEGRWFRSKNGEQIVIPNANGANPRYDRVVLRCDYSDRNVYFHVISGTPAVSPVPPSVVRDGTFYDLSLAVIMVNAGATSISQAAISDTRADTSVCGYVTGLIDQIDTTELFAQFEAQWVHFLDSLGDNNKVHIETVDTKTRAIAKAASIDSYLWVKNPNNLNLLKAGL